MSEDWRTASGTTSAPRARRAIEREQRTRRRRVAAATLLALIGVAIGLAVYSAGAQTDGAPQASGSAAASDEISLVADGEVLARISPDRAARLGAGRGLMPVPAERTVERQGARQTLEIDREILRERLAAADEGGTIVEVPQRVSASRVEVPIVKQVYRNNCETAALSMLLASVGVDRDQLELQDEIATSGPLDPQTNADGEAVWGDPNQGFVGRPPGGGPAGGFGVFEKPVLDLAARWTEPIDLTDKQPAAIYRRLLQGRAVMTWIGLSDGPYESWVSPDGTEITVNYGEHTVVLTGIAGDRLFVNDPLDGLRKVWTKAEFEAKWELLDRRAISV